MKQSATQLPPLHTSPVPHDVPSEAFGCVQLPEPSQVSVVQGLPSSVQEEPEPALTIVQPPLPSQVELVWQSVAVHE
jgi:hypothetical protein